MEKLFISVLNMSLIGSFVIVFVLIARFLLKKAPKIFTYALWSIVLFRLLCPFSFESALSLVPVEPAAISQEVIASQLSAIVVTGTTLPAPWSTDGANPLQMLVFVGAVVWLIGVVAMLIYSVASFIKLSRGLIRATPLKGNIYLADHISSPFVMGLFRPKIYLPSVLLDSEKDFIIAHEMHHVRRLDHLTRILGFAALAVHWFNPLVWVGFVASGKDMELSCDEAVMKNMRTDIRAEYSQALLRFGAKRGMIHATPLAFGKGDTKSRVKNVLNYKKPAFWVIAICVITVAAVGIGLASNPKSEPLPADYQSAIMINDQIYRLNTDENEAALAGETWLFGQIQKVSPPPAPPSENFEAVGYEGKDIYISFDGNTLYLDSLSGGKRLQLVLDETQVQTSEYSITKHGENGDVMAEGSIENMELARDIMMDGLVKSVAWEAIDISALDEYYLIRQTFAKSGEIHDYYAFRLSDDTSALQKGRAVLQSGEDGIYSTLSGELYNEMANLF